MKASEGFLGGPRRSWEVLGSLGKSQTTHNNNDIHQAVRPTACEITAAGFRSRGLSLVRSLPRSSSTPQINEQKRLTCYAHSHKRCAMQRNGVETQEGVCVLFFTQPLYHMACGLLGRLLGTTRPFCSSTKRHYRNLFRDMGEIPCTPVASLVLQSHMRVQGDRKQFWIEPSDRRRACR